MPIIDDVSAQIKDSMRARDKLRTQALRNIRAAFIAALKEDGSETLSDDQAVTILRKLAKQRHESIEAYEKAGRTESADEEKAELAIIDAFLPSLADEATTRGWVEAAIATTGASSPRDMGRVMGTIMKEHKGEVDGKIAKDLALALLSGA